ncbi:MAG: hypothetical protein MK082_07300 [Phycisphaerales bacterium]|nr:hypothetical protein [Phycisphaerales bacterium]
MLLRQDQHNKLFLLDPDAIKSGCTGLDEYEIAPMRKILDWARHYLFKPSPRLGRKGPVCPFVKPALEQHRSLFLTSVRTPHLNVDALAEKLYGYRDWFTRLEPTDCVKRNFKTILVMLPDLCDLEKGPEFIESVHSRLKPDWVKMGLMLGQFYPSCDAEGLHNADYRPLQSPTPLLVMRHMQLTDLPFLVKTEQFIRSYCRTFAVQDAQELQRRITEAQIPKLPRNWDECIARVFSQPELLVGEG